MKQSFILFSSLFFLGLFICADSNVNAQGVGINSTGAPADSSAILDVSATNKGMLIPRLTTAQRDAISNPAQSLLIYNITTKCFETLENDIWHIVWCVGFPCSTPIQPGAISGSSSSCQGSTQIYSVINAGVTYTWTFPSGWTQTAGGTTNSVTVTVGSGSGNIQIVPSNGCGNGIAQTLAVTSVVVPDSPTAGNSASSETQIAWNWSVVSGAIGYKYNTVDDYGSATNIGTGTTYNQTGLTCGTAYTLYVWAYNSCGNSSSTVITKTTSSCCPSGIINTIAGTGTAGYNGDGIAATSAQLNLPRAVAFDGFGNVYIADGDNHRIRKISVSGLISTVAGTGTAGFSGDGGAATSAQLNNPWGVTSDASGNLYIADFSNNRIRKVTASTGIISTIAGTGTAGYNGDGIAATNVQLNFPYGVALDGSGNLYIADRSNNRIRKVTVSTGLISTVAGNGTAGFSGDGGTATSGQLNQPHGVALDASGNVYIAEFLNHIIRKVTVATGIISTIAGNGIAGYNGDGIVATSAQLNAPPGVAVDGTGNVYIADFNNNRIRKVTISTGLISTIVGTGAGGFNGDGIAATATQLNVPPGVAVDASGNVYIPDYSNNRVRRVCY